jgi:hypothetical protein
MKNAGPRIKAITEELLKSGEPGVHTAPLAEGDAVPQDWRERWEPLTRLMELGGAGRSRIRRWVWSFRDEPWFGEPSTLVCLIRDTEGKVHAGFGKAVSNG